MSNAIVNLGYVHTRNMRPMPIPDDYPEHVLGHWQSRDYLAVLYQEPTGLRLTINRTRKDARTGDWVDGITWDDLMRVKQGCGFGDRWAVELYPPSSEVVNVANMRHLWLIDEPAFGW